MFQVQWKVQIPLWFQRQSGAQLQLPDNRCLSIWFSQPRPSDHSMQERGNMKLLLWLQSCAVVLALGLWFQSVSSGGDFVCPCVLVSGCDTADGSPHGQVSGDAGHDGQPRHRRQPDARHLDLGGPSRLGPAVPAGARGFLRRWGWLQAELWGFFRQLSHL